MVESWKTSWKHSFKTVYKGNVEEYKERLSELLQWDFPHCSKENDVNGKWQEYKEKLEALKELILEQYPNMVLTERNEMTLGRHKNDMLLEAMEYCDKNDKSTEFMLEYMQSEANVDLDTVLEFLETEES